MRLHKEGNRILLTSLAIFAAILVIEKIAFTNLLHHILYNLSYIINIIHTYRKILSYAKQNNVS